ncbi:MAG TPA: hypothetical protein VEQ10_05410 [Vicinamibacteria bacterium]|nr:hypothetical protein [Vicinamibacteria bacterium]
METAGRKPGEAAIFVYRKGNGGAFVSESPAVVAQGGTIWVVNLTECPAEVEFPDRSFDPAEASLAPRGGAQQFTAVGAQGYHEYDVELDCGKGVRQEVEGNSRPGAIIDP